jgi:hypothetical protein
VLTRMGSRSEPLHRDWLEFRLSGDRFVVCTWRERWHVASEMALFLASRDTRGIKTNHVIHTSIIAITADLANDG